MKKCDHIRDLILTDYLDGELDKNLADSVEGHLLDCGDCRAFFKEIKNSVRAPFQQSLPQAPPAELWEVIRKEIEQKNQAPNPLVDFIGKIKGILAFPRLVPVFASVLLMFLAGTVALNMVHVQQARDKDQGEYLISLLGAPGSSAAPNGNDGATPIEHYFL